MERESANPEFAFMFNLQSPEHMYFRWRLYSLAQGERPVHSHGATSLKWSELAVCGSAAHVLKALSKV